MAISEVKGLSDLLLYLSDSPVNMHRGVRVGLYVGAKLIEVEAKSNCPVEHGSLRDSIRVKIKEADNVIVSTIAAGGKIADGSYIKYAHLVEFSGAAPHIIQAAAGKSLAFAGKEFQSVNHPGMKAKPFLRPALDANEVAAIGALDQEIESALQK